MISWLKRWWNTDYVFLTIKSAEGKRTFPGDVTREEYEAWRDRIHEAGIKRIEHWWDK